MHILYLLTRWKVEVDVYWLPPVHKNSPRENPLEFSNRIKNIISKTVGLKNVQWNGYLKNASIAKDVIIMKESIRHTYKNTIDSKKKLSPYNKKFINSKFFGKLSYEEFFTNAQKQYLVIKQSGTFKEMECDEHLDNQCSCYEFRKSRNMNRNCKFFY